MDKQDTRTILLAKLFPHLQTEELQSAVKEIDEKVAEKREVLRARTVN